jgi:hypothetical protein
VFGLLGLIALARAGDSVWARPAEAAPQPAEALARLAVKPERIQ